MHVPETVYKKLHENNYMDITSEYGHVFGDVWDFGILNPTVRFMI